MTLLTNPSDLEPVTTFIGMFYGQPGTWKTTTALSSPSPVLIDLERGLKRVDPRHRVPSLQVENYDQVLKLLDSDELRPFETIVFDTIGALIEHICNHVADNNPKARQYDGQMSQKGWGEVGATFVALLGILKRKGKNVMFVAHESEEKNGDSTMKRPDCAGSARKTIVKKLDFMGYFEMIGRKPTVSFSPTEAFYAKNSLGLDSSIELPDISDGKPNNFVAKYIVGMSAKRLDEQTVLRKQYDDLLAQIDAAVMALANVEEVNAFYEKTLGEFPVVWDSVYYAKQALKDKVDALGIEFDRASKKFVVKPPKAEPEAPAAGEAAGETKAEEAAVAPKKGGKKKAAAEEAPAADGEGSAPAGDGKEEIDDSKFSV